MSTPSFDRIRPASVPRPSAPVIDARDDDVQGKRALFSGAEQPPSVGSVALECDDCQRRSVISLIRLARMFVTTPGLYVPTPGTRQRAWVKCPACNTHSWVTMTRS